MKLFYTNNSKTTLIIRLMIGVVFISEGIQKFLFPELRGVGRFETIGLPYPEFLAYFVGAFEIISGFLVLIGLFTRLGAISLIIIMLVAISTTKIDILLDKGFWEMMHAARTDFSMLLGSIFILIKGSGFWSLDYKWFSSGKER